MKELLSYSLTEHQFAQVLGKARLYQHLPNDIKSEIGVPFKLLDTQVSAIADHYYNDVNFSKNADGSISLWNMYNLLTGANKSSYINDFADRSVNAFEFTNSLADALEYRKHNWFLE